MASAGATRSVNEFSHTWFADGSPLWTAWVSQPMVQPLGS
jgi:hypothetical protein